MKIRDTVFLRVIVLLVAAIALVQSASYLMLREFAREPAVELISSLIVAIVSGDVDRMDAMNFAPLSVRTVASPERTSDPLIPFDQEILNRLEATLPEGAELRLGRPLTGSILWIRLAGEDRWFEISGFGVSPRLYQVLSATAVVAGLLVVLAAAAAARLLVRPLEHLADRAPDLALGRDSVVPRGPWEVQRIGHSLREAAAMRAEIERDRELLLAGISHDLRAPLARLRLRAQLADQEEPFSDDLDELEAIVDSFIGYVRDGRDEKLCTIDQGWIEKLAEPYMNRGLVLVTEPLEARVRPLALKRAVVNLLENAYRHGWPPVSLTVRSLPTEWRILVEDRGAGLDEARFRSALKPFESFDEARGSCHRGLGLATVQRIVEAHGGNLRLSNHPQGGLRVCLRLPLDAPDK